jgi:hypothetical protein
MQLTAELCRLVRQRLGRTAAARYGRGSAFFDLVVSDLAP